MNAAPTNRARGVARLLVVLLAGLCAVPLGACGWHAGLAPDVPAGSTAAVSFLGNQSRVPDVEVELTRALTDALVDRVGLSVAHPTEADYLVRGVLLDYRRRGGVRTRDNEQLETGVELVVRLEWVRRADLVVLGTTERRLAAGFALDDRGLATDAPAEREQRQRAIANLAEGLILDLLRPPAYKGVE